MRAFIVRGNKVTESNHCKGKGISVQFLSGVLLIISALGLGGSTITPASALPFNDDMADSQAIRTGQIVRSAPDETVAVGSLKYRVESKEEALKLTNPHPVTATALRDGKRLFQVNCTPCHGTFTDEGIEPTPIMGRSIMPGPDLSNEFYAGRPDGLFYGTIHFGGVAVMPRVGYKLSPKESWDIVSYIRSEQEKSKNKGKK